MTDILQEMARKGPECRILDYPPQWKGKRTGWEILPMLLRASGHTEKAQEETKQMGKQTEMTTNPLPPKIPTPVKSVLYTHINLVPDQKKMALRIRTALRENTHRDMSVPANRLTLADDLKKVMSTARLKPNDTKIFIKIAINELHKSSRDFPNMDDTALTEITNLLKSKR